LKKLKKIKMPDPEKELTELENFEQARKFFPLTENCVYLDSAHYGPYPLLSNYRLKKFIDEITYTNKNLSIFVNEIKPVLKEKISRLIKAKPDDIILTSNTTHGLNIFANGIELNKGDSVAFCNNEFPAIAYPWLNQQLIRYINVVQVPSNRGIVNLELVEKYIREYSVKVFTISYVGFLGYRTDLEILSEICKNNKCYLVVDAIQNIGACPLYVNKNYFDFMAAGSQKWMLAPAGIGFAWISDKMRHKIHPSYLSTINMKFDFEKFLNYDLNYVDNASVYENSTVSVLGMIGLNASVDIFLKLGVENIYFHIIINYYHY